MPSELGEDALTASVGRKSTASDEGLQT